MSPKLSIITPAFNAREQWKRAYDSLDRQTLKDIEWLVIDDGSNDGTYDLLMDLSSQDMRVRVFSQEHGGAGTARNYGLSEAAGEYVTFLDIDDEYYDIDALEKMYSVGKANDANVIGSYRVTEYFDGIVDEPLFREFGDISLDGKWCYFKDYQDDFHFHSYMFRLSFLKENDLEFPEFRRYQDPVFLLKALDIAEKVLVVPVILYKYHNGHQDMEVVTRNVYEALKGIKENLSIAHDRGYDVLYERLINRLNIDFLPMILRNFSHETNKLLLEIEDINKQHSDKFFIAPLRYVREVSERAIDSQMFDGLCDKYEQVTVPDNLIEQYLLNTEISKIAIYGYGVMGRKLYKTLKGSKIIISGIIDRNKPDDIETEYFKPENVKYIKCDAIIVSPIRYGSIVKELENNGIKKVVILKDLVDKLVRENL